MGNFHKLLFAKTGLLYIVVGIVQGRLLTKLVYWDYCFSWYYDLVLNRH